MKSSESAYPLGAPNILLVDDNRNGLIVRRALLEEVGCQVRVANCGEEALRLLAAAAADIVVTDYRMPRMDGAELIRRIRKHDPNTRIILLSGFVDPLGLTEESTGADVVLAKSANEPVQLVRSVKRLVSRNAPRKPPSRQRFLRVAGASKAR
jgi:CheY-like chemotaxis protein